MFECQNYASNKIDYIRIPRCKINDEWQDFNASLWMECEKNNWNYIRYANKQERMQE